MQASFHPDISGSIPNFSSFTQNMETNSELKDAVLLRPAAPHRSGATPGGAALIVMFLYYLDITQSVCFSNFLVLMLTKLY